MIIVKKAVPRRTVLRGLGATLALPLLDGMVPAATALAQTAARPAARFCTVYVPNGLIMEAWDAGGRGERLRADPDAEAARAVAPPPAGAQRPRQHRGQLAHGELRRARQAGRRVS